MTTNEKRALQLARSVFEHFTKDSLALAKEILTLESEMKMNSG